MAGAVAHGTSLHADPSACATSHGTPPVLPHAVMVYWMAGFTSSAGAFFMYTAVLLASGLVFGAMFIVLAALCPTLQVAGGLSGESWFVGQEGAFPPEAAGCLSGAGCRTQHGRRGAWRSCAHARMLWVHPRLSRLPTTAAGTATPPSPCMPLAHNPLLAQASSSCSSSCCPALPSCASPSPAGGSGGCFAQCCRRSDALQQCGLHA